MEYYAYIGTAPTEPWNQTEPVEMEADTLKELGEKMRDYLVDNNIVHDFFDDDFLTAIIETTVHAAETENVVCKMNFTAHKGIITSADAIFPNNEGVKLF